MTTEQIQNLLFQKQDKTYAAFQAKLIPNINPATIIGVRTPDIKELAKSLFNDSRSHSFLSCLPHRYFDENQVHAFSVSLIKNFDECLKAVTEFLPYIDNWATCDQLNPPVFKKHKNELLAEIKSWLKSNHVYTVRFAIKCLMQHFLDKDFSVEYARLTASIHSDEYYIQMMQAWYFATALAKQYETILPFFTDKSLDINVHNKAIQKACESFRVSEEHKAELKNLKIKTPNP
jgi:3-methyladenine DNA glycosylase AlkD